MTLKLDNVKNIIAVPFSHLDTLVKTYRVLASGAIPGACQVAKGAVAASDSRPAVACATLDLLQVC